MSVIGRTRDRSKEMPIARDSYGHEFEKLAAAVREMREHVTNCEGRAMRQRRLFAGILFVLGFVALAPYGSKAWSGALVFATHRREVGSNAARMVAAHEFQLVDDRGRRVAEFAFDGRFKGPSIRLYDAKGALRGRLALLADGSPALTFWDEGGVERAAMLVNLQAIARSAGFLRLEGLDGSNILLAGGDKGSPGGSLQFTNVSVKASLDLSLKPVRNTIIPWLRMFDDTGAERAVLGIEPSGVASLRLAREPGNRLKSE